MNKSLPIKNHKKHKENDIRQRIKRQKSAKVKLTDKLIAVRKNYKEAHYYKEYFRNIKKYVN